MSGYLYRFSNWIWDCSLNRIIILPKTWYSCRKNYWTIYVWGILRWFRYKDFAIGFLQHIGTKVQKKHGSQITGIYGMIQNSALWMWLIEYPFWVNSKCSALGMKATPMSMGYWGKRKQGNFLVQWRKEKAGRNCLWVVVRQKFKELEVRVHRKNEQCIGWDLPLSWGVLTCLARNSFCVWTFLFHSEITH